MQIAYKNKFLKKAMKCYGRPEEVVTDRLRSYGAAMREIGNADRQITGRQALSEELRLERVRLKS